MFNTARSQAFLILLILIAGIVGASFLASVGKDGWAIVVFLAGYLIFTYMPLPKELREFEQKNKGQ